MHHWGDGFDFKKLNKAMVFICNYVENNSKCWLMCKEKYGSIRYEHIFPKGKGTFYNRSVLGRKLVHWLLHDKNDKMYWPSNINPKPWYKKIIYTYIYPRPYRSIIEYLDNKKIKKGYKALKDAIEKAMLKYPDIMHEIVADSPFEEHKRLQFNIKPQKLFKMEV